MTPSPGRPFLRQWKRFRESEQSPTQNWRMGYSRQICRNNRFYGSTSNCPHCNKCEETLSHVFTCMAPEVLEECEELLRIYAMTLSDCGTPSDIIEWFHHGLQQWGQLSNGLVGRQIPPAADISKQVLTVAYADQTRVVGWEPFMRGRISNKWASAYKAFYSDASDHEVTAWMSDVIRANMDLGLELWKHRNRLIHGRDQAEAKQKVGRDLKKKVREAFGACHKDPFIIPRTCSALFDRYTLDQRVNQDCDTLKCWLADVDEAKLVQRDNRERAALAAQTFFLPRRKVPPKTDRATARLPHCLESGQSSRQTVTRTKSRVSPQVRAAANKTYRPEDNRPH
jgi:hypothetical protein